MLDLHEQLTHQFMKLEVLPKTALTNELIIDFLNKNYLDFLRESDNRYYYWNDLKKHSNLPYENLLESWSLIKLHRRGSYQRLHFGKKDFNFYATNQLQGALYFFDVNLIGENYENPIHPKEQEGFLKELLFEEAWASYKLEGGKMDRDEAIHQISSQQSPQSEEEHKLANTHQTLTYALSQTSKKLDESFLENLYLRLYRNLSDESRALSYRTTKALLHNQLEGEVAHIAPNPEDIEGFMADLFVFVNSNTPFYHPVIKASIIHFMITYIQPFHRNNGVLARALFYWYLAKNEYHLIRNMAVSRVILNSSLGFEKAGLQSRNDENDLTYFIRYLVRCLDIAFKRLMLFRNKKLKQQEEANLIAYKIITRGFHKRQADLIGALYTNEKESINITSYAKNQGIVRQTARKDLNALVDAGLITESKKGRNVVFKISDKNKIIAFIRG